MRVIAGEFRGRALQTPDWDGLRPTSDRLRETLFNILGPSIRGGRVLDGCAGTGAVGIEALSRGAAHVTFVEKDPRAIRLIRDNLARVFGAGSEQARNRYAIIRAWFGEYARQAAGEPWDVVFLDPPYGAAELAAALRDAPPLVGADTRLIVEHARRDDAPDRAGPLARVRVVTSGDSALAFYRRADGGAPPAGPIEAS